MEALEAIFTRRSIRHFTDELVPDAMIDQLLKAGSSAPSTHEIDGLHFVVIRERKMLDSIPKIHPHSKVLLEATVAICVCMDLNKEKFPGLGYWIQDCSAVTENMLIAATALGLGTCWLGIHPRDERKNYLHMLLNLPEDTEPFSLVAVGHPNESKPRNDNFLPENVHHDKW